MKKFRIVIMLLIFIVAFNMFKDNVYASNSKVLEFQYYNQGNYSHVPYCSDDGGNVAKSGCGATSLAVIASSFTNNNYNPKVVANYLCENGFGGKNGTGWRVFTNTNVLNHFELNVEVLFKKEGTVKGNAGKTYSEEEGNKILNAVNNGRGIILHIPGHYVVVGPNPKCSKKQVYYYQVSNSDENGCYTPKELFNSTYNYKDRCSKKGNCGWKAAFSYKGISEIKVYFNSNGAVLENDKYKLGSTNNILKKSDGNKFYKTYKYNAKEIDLPNYNGTIFNMTYVGMKNSSPFWNTKSDGSGIKFYQTAKKHDAKELFDASGCTADEDCEITLYGQWNPIKYYIHYVGNGATGQVYDKGHCDSNGNCGLDVYTDGTEYDEENQIFKHATKHRYNKEVTLRKNRFYKEGYIFNGWSESATGDVKYSDKDIVKNLTNKDGNVIYLYAQWVEGQGNNNISELEEDEIIYDNLEEDDNIDNSSNNEYEIDEEETVNKIDNEVGFVDEDYGDDTFYEEDNIKNSPQTGSSKYLVVTFIFFISIIFIIYYRKKCFK